MSSTANFIIIQDGPSTLSANPVFHHPDRVEFPAVDAGDADLGLRPVLTFQVTAGGDVTLTITLNQVEVISKSLASLSERMWSEVVNENILQVNTNELIASVTGPGLVIISDLVLWYRK